MIDAMERGLRLLTARLAEAEARSDVTTNIHDLLLVDEHLVGFAADDDLLCDLHDMYDQVRHRQRVTLGLEDEPMELAAALRHVQQFGFGDNVDADSVIEQAARRQLEAGGRA